MGILGQSSYSGEGAFGLLLLLSLLAAIACGVIGAIMARRRSRPWWAGAVLGYFLNVIGLAIIAVLGPRTTSAVPPMVPRPDAQPTTPNGP